MTNLFHHPGSVQRKVIVVLVSGLLLGTIFSVIKAYVTSYAGVRGTVLNNGETVGGDFICFYIAGEQMREDASRLYDFDFLRDRQRAVVGDGIERLGRLPFLYPPLVALLFSAFSSLSLLHAYFAWSVTSLILYSLAIFLLFMHIPVPKPIRLFVLAASFAFVPFSVDCLGAGQTSCIGLLVYAGVFCLLKKKMDFRAGCVLALSYYKPPLFAIFVLFMIMHRRRKMMYGFLASAAVLLALTIGLVGTDGLLGYLKQSSAYASNHGLFMSEGLTLKKGVSLFALFYALVVRQTFLARAVFILTIPLTLWIMYRNVISIADEDRKSQTFDLVFALEMALSLLLAPYMLAYDLTMVLIPLIIVWSVMYNTGFSRPAVFNVLCAIGLYVEFLIGPVIVVDIRIQTAALFFLLWVLSLGLLVQRHKGTV